MRSIKFFLQHNHRIMEVEEVSPAQPLLKAGTRRKSDSGWSNFILNVSGIGTLTLSLSLQFVSSIVILHKDFFS